MREPIIRSVMDKKVIAIMRGMEPASCVSTAKALLAGGICHVEVTFDQKSNDCRKTADAIEAIIEELPREMRVGAGTVLTLEQVDIAAKAGAEYIISPDVNEAVIRHTIEMGLVSMPGALTPSEVMAAHRYGADFVKLFPAGNMGASYIKAVRAPISHVKLLAVGGVSAENAKAFITAGCVGVGVGGNLVNKEWIERGEFEKITQAAREIIDAVASEK